MTEIEHEGTDEVVCPYCGYKYGDSWEFSDNTDELICDECNKKFNMSRNISVDYTTSKIVCSKINQEHNFVFKRELMSTSESIWMNGEWKDVKLSEDKWKYREIFACIKCDEKDYRVITKEEYMKKYPEDYKRWRNYYYRKK